MQVKIETSHMLVTLSLLLNRYVSLRNSGLDLFLLKVPHQHTVQNGREIKSHTFLVSFWLFDL